MHILSALKIISAVFQSFSQVCQIFSLFQYWWCWASPGVSKGAFLLDMFTVCSDAGRQPGC